MQRQFEASSQTGPVDGTGLVDAIPRCSGLDWLVGAMAGTLPRPPFVDEIGIRITHAEEGFVIGEYAVQDRHLNGLNTLHGGVLATIADTAGSCAVLTTAAIGVLTPTLEMKINFLRPVVRGSEPLRAEGRVIARGRTTGLAEARITDATGRQVAHATVTCSILVADGKDVQ